MRVLVTGGAGYIGSHTVLALVAAGHEPVIVDTFTNSQPEVIDQLERVTGKTINCYKADAGDANAIAAILQAEPCEALIHFAALKAVGESLVEPLRYYQTNVNNFVTLLQAATNNGVQHVVLSSTAAVYGTPAKKIVSEASPAQPESPYGFSKYMDEIILRDLCASGPLRGTVLRYFNVVGCDPDGRIGEVSRTTPQNLLPIIIETVAGKRNKLIINGDDYPTKDGTCERDYVHVSDLADAHVVALERTNGQAFDTFNISTGKATSILALIKTFEQSNTLTVPYEIGPRRAGDPAAYYAKATKANDVLGWQPTQSLKDACRSAWQWQLNHPEGYATQSYDLSQLPEE